MSFKNFKIAGANLTLKTMEEALRALKESINEPPEEFKKFACGKCKKEFYEQESRLSSRFKKLKYGIYALCDECLFGNLKT